MSGMQPTQSRSAVSKRFSHILFVTRYCGLTSVYRNGYFIVGFVEIGEFQVIDAERTAIKAKAQHFVGVEDAWEVTADRWQEINKNGKTRELSNLRHATQVIDGELFEKILRHLQKGTNRLSEYIREVTRMTDTGRAD